MLFWRLWKMETLYFTHSTSTVFWALFMFFLTYMLLLMRNALKETLFISISWQFLQLKEPRYIQIFTSEAQIQFTWSHSCHFSSDNSIPLVFALLFACTAPLLTHWFSNKRKRCAAAECGVHAGGNCSHCPQAVHAAGGALRGAREEVWGPCGKQAPQ